MAAPAVFNPDPEEESGTKPDLSVVEGGGSDTGTTSSPELSVVEGGRSEQGGYQGPESVTLQPESVRQQQEAARSDPLTGGTERRVTAEDQASLARDLPDSDELFLPNQVPDTAPEQNVPVPGEPDNQPMTGEPEVLAGIGDTNPPASAKKGRGRFGSLMNRFRRGKGKNSSAGPEEEGEAQGAAGKAAGAAAGAVAEAKNQLLDQAKRQLKSAIIKFAVTYLGGPVGIVLGVILLIIVIIIVFLAVGYAAAPDKPGDPTGSVAAGSGSLASLKSAYNPDGIYCKEMSPDITSLSTGKKVMLPTLEGEVWNEEEAVAPGKLAPTAVKQGYLALAGTKRNNSVDNQKVGFTDEELKYYLNMRWMYRMWYFNGRSVANPGGPRASDLAGRKMYVAVLKTMPDGSISADKMYTGIIAETGPAPWTGTGYTLDGDGNVVPGSNGVETPDQKLEWGKVPRPDTPLTYTGRVLGVAPELGKALSENGTTANDSHIIVGFAPDNAKLDGQPVTCTPYKNLVASGSNIPTNGVPQPLDVPGVKEGTGGDCGQASTIMVAKYYRPTFGSLPNESFFYDVANNQTKDDISCVAPSYINDHTDDKATDFVRAVGGGSSSAPKASWDDIRRSLYAGDPVIIYTSPGSVYPGTPHIFVLVGYNSSTKRFIVNNPFVHGVEVKTETPNGVEMTEEHLNKYLGETYYPHHTSFMIRKKHISQ